MYGPDQDRESYLGVVPLAVAGVATGAIKGVSKVLGGLFGGGGPPYADAVDRVKQAKKDALSGQTSAKSYGDATKAPVKYLSDIAGLTASGSRYPEARAAASKALQLVADSAPEPNRGEAAAALGGGGTPEAYAAPAPSGMPMGSMVLAGGLALLAFTMLRKGRR